MVLTDACTDEADVRCARPARGDTTGEGTDSSVGVLPCATARRVSLSDVGANDVERAGTDGVMVASFPIFSCAVALCDCRGKRGEEGAGGGGAGRRVVRAVLCAVLCAELCAELTGGITGPLKLSALARGAATTASAFVSVSLLVCAMGGCGRRGAGKGGLLGTSRSGIASSTANGRRLLSELPALRGAGVGRGGRGRGRGGAGSGWDREGLESETERGSG